MRKNGFTLIEIIVVIAIIGILAAIVTPNAFKAVEKAKIVRITADIKGITAAAQAYYSDVSLWPPDVCPEEDPGFIQSSNYLTRCCGQNYEFLPANYQAIIANNWDGPYLEKFPFPTPWGGSYDWEFWPGGGWSQPPGVYVSVRPKYNSIQQGAACGWANPAIGSCPSNFEVKLQQQGLDVYIPSGNVNVSDGTIIIPITHF